MGVFKPYDVACPNCDNHYQVTLTDTVNVTRFPHLKRMILDRALNCGVCSNCGYLAPVEKPFMYLDLAASLHVSVYPRKERHFYKQASTETDVMLEAVSSLKVPKPKMKRVAFGLEELREKIVARDANLDDATVEAMKLYVIKEHPFLIQKRRMRISLEAASAEKLDFYCTFDHDDAAFIVSLPSAFLDALGRKGDGQAAPRERRSFEMLTSAFTPDAGKAAWVNLWQLNPSNDSLAQLSKFAQAIRNAQPGDNNPVDLSSADFTKMVATLPRGNQLPGWAKRDLQTISDYANGKNRGDIEDALFEVRFGIELEDDWFKNSDKYDIKTIWTLLKNLPDIAVEGNSWIKSITLDTTTTKGGGVYYGGSRKEISIGSGMQSDSYAFRNVVLHEVGHGVHEMIDRKNNGVSTWLSNTYGWTVLEPTAAGIDTWIAAMGGYGQITPQQKTEIRGFVQQSMGSGATFNAAAIVSGPTNHPWNNPNFGPRKAFENSGTKWWTRCDSWHLFNGRRFFVNYYYSKLMILTDAAVQLVVQSMPSRYATMSQFEFFAELFAWFYDANSPKRNQIPPAVSTWLTNNVGTLDPASPFATPAPAQAALAAPAASKRAPRKRQAARPARRPTPARRPARKRKSRN